MIKRATQLRAGDEILVTFLNDLAVYQGKVTRVFKRSLGAKMRTEGDEFDVLIVCYRRKGWELSGQSVVLHAVEKE